MEKIAIIDLGSNTARLVIARILDGGYFVIEDEFKESVRLSQDMERDGYLKAPRIAETVKTLKMFKKLCNSHKINTIIPVATAAVRRAKNQKSFLEEIAATTGIKLRVLSAEEEAAYVYHGVINSMDIPKGLIMEIGGGSTKIIHYNRRNILFYETLPFGAVTLTELFANDNLKPEEQAAKIEEFFTEQLKQMSWLPTIDEDTQFIGVGGSFRNLCKIGKMLRKYPLDMIHNYNMGIDDFNNIYDMLKVLDIDKKKKIKGISTGRADILPSAFSAIKAMVDYKGIKNIVISGCGLREGLMFNYAVPQTIEKPITDVMNHSIHTLIRYYELDAEHTARVVDLSTQLFKQLRVLHKFSRINLKILKVAANLHDCGNRIKYYNHQRHASYMILNSNLFALSHREIIMAALTAAAQRKDEVNLNDILKFKDILVEEDLDIIKKLGVMLRIAESFDRSKGGCIKGINCDVLGDSVIMKTEQNGDAQLEVRDAYGASSDFKKAFRKNLEII